MIVANTYYYSIYLKTHNIIKSTICRLNKDQGTLIEQSLTLIQQSGYVNVL